MTMIKKSTDGKTRILSLSYGKDSLACLGAIELLGWELDKIVTIDIWATDNIRADYPEVLAFMDYADKEIEERYGIKVEHCCVMRNGKKMTYEKMFYKRRQSGKRAGQILGFPMIGAPGCITELKIPAISQIKKMGKAVIQYLGIAKNEAHRFHTLSENRLSPLVEVGWTEDDTKRWCEENGLLSPVYRNLTRTGCWFCQNQTVSALRVLRNAHPELWELLLKWDADSPVKFHANGKTVHDYDTRFILEDEGRVPKDRRFRWKSVWMLTEKTGEEEK